jgi:hypothetical protein
MAKADVSAALNVAGAPSRRIPVAHLRDIRKRHSSGIRPLEKCRLAKKRLIKVTFVRSANLSSQERSTSSLSRASYKQRGRSQRTTQ